MFVLSAIGNVLMTILAWIIMHVIDWNTNGSNVFIFTLDTDNAFDLEFDDVNVYGEKLVESSEHFCCQDLQTHQVQSCNWTGRYSLAESLWAEERQRGASYKAVP